MLIILGANGHKISVKPEKFNFEKWQKMVNHTKKSDFEKS